MLDSGVGLTPQPDQTLSGLLAFTGNTFWLLLKLCSACAPNQNCIGKPVACKSNHISTFKHDWCSFWDGPCWSQGHGWQPLGLREGRPIVILRSKAVKARESRLRRLRLHWLRRLVGDAGLSE